MNSSDMTPSERRSYFAKKAYDESEDKLATEKTIYIDGGSFEYCIRDKNKHHKECIRRKGFIRTYHKPFWTKNPGGLGKTYHMGIVLIVNKDAEVNKEYEIKTLYPEGEINYRVKSLRHRLISISVGPYGGQAFDCSFTLTFTPQRNKFDD